MKRSTSWLLLCMLTLVTIPTVMAQPNYNYSKLQREKLGRGVIAIRENPYGAYNEAVFSMVGENGRKALRTKGFKYDRENGLNISKRFSFT